MTRSRDFAQGATRTEFIYTATAGQTSFSGNDTNSVSLAYTVGQIDVYLNGSRLAPADYTATNGTAVVLGVGAEASDTLQINAFGTFNVANVVATRDLEGNEFVLDDDGDTTITADTDDQIDIKIAGADDFQFTANKFLCQTGSNIDMNGTELILDADADTSITADTDDQVDLKIGGSDKVQFFGNGQILFGKTTNDFGTAGGCFNDGGSKNGALELICNGEASLALNRLSSDGAIIVFHKDGSSGGSITTTASSTTYATSSDYRLKENVDYTFDATTRLKQLKPCRFNFIVDESNTLVDGFIAHEVSSIVPEAIIGTKDATRTATNVVTDSSDNYIGENVLEEDWIEGKADGVYANNTKWVATKTMPKYQQIDQAKLVPLLVKTIQELEARIKTLEDA